VKPGDLGENITTKEVELLELGSGTRLVFVNGGEEQDKSAVVRITGLRNPCPQIDKFQKGLKEGCLLRDEERNVVGRKAGVMGVVEVGGVVRVGARILVKCPAVFESLECV